MARSINTTRRSIQEIADHANNFGAVRVGLLAEDYDGIGKTVRLRIGSSASSPTVQARIKSASVLSSPLPEGTPVSFRVLRGRVEILAIGVGDSPLIRATYYKAAAQSVANTTIATLAKITFAAANALSDVYSLLDDTNDRLVAPQAGYYDIQGYAAFAANANGQRRVAIYINGAVKWIHTWSAGVAQIAGYSIHHRYDLAADDYVELFVGHNSTTTPLNVTESLLGLELVR